MVGSDPDLSGALLEGRYLLVDRIGRGGMGTVYRARDVESGGQIAVKVVSPEKAAQRRQGDRFRRELHALQLVEHPNTVKVHQDGETEDGFLWIAMELVEGTTLARRISGKPMPADEIEIIVRQVLGALAAIHAAGLVHRDLKPGNVMIQQGPDGGLVAKVLDFGIVRFVDPDPDMSALTNQNTILGTPEFMSPELIQTGAIDHRSDLYALGVCMYQMATGELPFTGAMAGPILHAHVHKMPDPVEPRRGSPLPPSLARLLDALLEKDPRARPQSAEDAIAILDGRLAPPPRRGVPERRLVVGMFVGAAVIGVVAGIALVLLLQLWLV